MPVSGTNSVTATSCPTHVSRLPRSRRRLTRASQLRYHAPPAVRGRSTPRAEVAELADARDSKSRGPCGHEGSTPSFGTNGINNLQRSNKSNALKKGMTLSVAVSDLCMEWSLVAFSPTGQDKKVRSAFNQHVGFENGVFTALGRRSAYPVPRRTFRLTKGGRKYPLQAAVQTYFVELSSIQTLLLVAITA